MILIRKSELQALGFFSNFEDLNWLSSRNLAALVLRARGDVAGALLLELNNPNAIAKITYVNDIG